MLDVHKAWTAVNSTPTIGAQWHPADYQVFNALNAACVPRLYNGDLSSDEHEFLRTHSLEVSESYFSVGKWLPDG